jgi:hypothetical protein
LFYVCQTTNPHAERRIAMTERTVTEQQVIDVLNKYGLTTNLKTINLIFLELFPEQPKLGELVKVWNGGLDGNKGWGIFLYIDKDGQVCTEDECGDEWLWDNYRRQTPAERGEG